MGQEGGLHLFQVHNRVSKHVERLQVAFRGGLIRGRCSVIGGYLVPNNHSYEIGKAPPLVPDRFNKVHVFNVPISLRVDGDGRSDESSPAGRNRNRLGRTLTGPNIN